MMTNEELLVIGEKEGFGKEFSNLVSMMAYARYTTILEVYELTTEQLDYKYAEDANSVGMLLAHLVAVEKFYQIDTFDKRQITDEDTEELNPGLELGAAAQEQIHGEPALHYLQEMKKTRARTLEMFKTLPDTWLYEQSPFFGGQTTNNYFRWFHVFEDELNHRGQIRLIKKMMRKEHADGEQ